jgi:hypothetical protein
MASNTCKCLEEIKFQLYEEALFQREVVSTQFKNTLAESKKGSPKPCTDVEVTLKGGLLVTVFFQNIYCPFCGIEINRGA